MSAPRWRLAGLARALAAAGRTMLPAGAALASLELEVAVAEPPVLAQDRLWRLAVAPRLPRWRRWLTPVLRSPAADWPRVKLTWVEGRVFASLIPPPAFTRST